MQKNATLKLKKNQEKRLQNGHLWIYSNEIDAVHTPLTSFIPGQLVQIETHSGKPVGIAYVNPHTLLCARLLAYSLRQTIDVDFIEQRLQQALQLRASYFKQPFYRLVYGESDNLPGLVIDRYGDYVVAQIATKGMENLKDIILLAIHKVLQPRGILWRNDSGARVVENLASYVTIADGVIPDIVSIVENNARFDISLTKGQKTGWFYDHRNNRALVQQFAINKRILDLFSYTGSFAIQAATAGAKEVHAVDSSAQAIEWLQHNANINGLNHKIHTIVGDVVETLKKLISQGEQFDVVLLDPPAFIKCRKDIKPGLKGYQRINELAMRLVTPGGLLVSSSCSLHCSRELLREVILQSSLRAQREVRLIKEGNQDIDHPIHPAIPETNYLKSFFCSIN